MVASLNEEVAELIDTRRLNNGISAVVRELIVRRSPNNGTSAVVRELIVRRSPNNGISAVVTEWIGQRCTNNGISAVVSVKNRPVDESTLCTAADSYNSHNNKRPDFFTHRKRKRSGLLLL